MRSGRARLLPDPDTAPVKHKKDLKSERGRKKKKEKNKKEKRRFMLLSHSSGLTAASERQGDSSTPRNVVGQPKRAGQRGHRAAATRGGRERHGAQGKGTAPRDPRAAFRALHELPHRLRTFCCASTQYRGKGDFSAPSPNPPFYLEGFCQHTTLGTARTSLRDYRWLTAFLSRFLTPEQRLAAIITATAQPRARLFRHTGSRG